MTQASGGVPSALVAEHGVPAWTVTGDSSANTARTITKAGEAAKKHYITGFSAVLGAAAAGADIAIQLKDGSTVKWKEIIGNAAASGTRVAVTFEHAIEMTENTAANLVSDAGGASAVVTLNLTGYTLPVS